MGDPFEVNGRSTGSDTDRPSSTGARSDRLMSPSFSFPIIRGGFGGDLTRRLGDVTRIWSGSDMVWAERTNDKVGEEGAFGGGEIDEQDPSD